MRLRREFKKRFFQRMKGWNVFKLFRRKRRTGSRILMILSGIGTAIAALQFFRNVNDKVENKEKRKGFSPVSPVVQRSPKRPAKRANYAWAAETAEEFLKKDARGKNSR